MRSRCPIFIGLLLPLLLSSWARAEKIHVGAAISLKEAIQEISKAYETTGNDRIDLSLGSSGRIATQIRNGADIDLFVSAANKQVDDLEKEMRVIAGSRRIVAYNSLVLIIPRDKMGSPGPRSFKDLAGAGVRRIAIGEPKTVPAGDYAQQVFKALTLADALAPKLVYGTNVRQVLDYVERSEVSAGVVYATDARESGDKVLVVATADAASHEPIVYPGVIVSSSKKQIASQRFMDFLTSAKAKEILNAKGFALPENAATRPAAK